MTPSMVYRTLAPLCAALMLCACNALAPYKIDIPQGNEITADQAAQLKVGMSRSQARFVLGTPLLADPFHANRWDYIVSHAKGGKLMEKKTFTVHFDGDTVSRWEGNTLPARKKFDGGEFALDASAPEPATNPAANPPAETRPLSE
ncbi:outer membrane protein assembly factor BamE [Andreprevotia sp. IGB-42]|uniref:outer membrane protein assembly factor BamE n=1 Tax=Andreprevotia sp. IGB-42 TaxID=2497473 RepID=UPI001F00374B|nr:outer membrane protein assembly factor BamE [Andreprevotia sp. IGB-42]